MEFKHQRLALIGSISAAIAVTLATPLATGQGSTEEGIAK